MLVSFSLFCFASSANGCDYVFGDDYDGYRIKFYNSESSFMFNNHKTVRPGLKITYNKPTGGITFKTVQIFNSEAETLKFLRNSLDSEEYQKAQKKIKYPKFRTQACTMRTREKYGEKYYNGRRQYLGRIFEIQTKFYSVVKDGSKYRVTIEPYTTSLLARTFLWSKACWSSMSEEKEFDQNRAYNLLYADEIDKYVNTMKKVVNAPYSVIVGKNVVQQIYQKLNPLIAAERQKFVALPY